ncbi:MAG: histidine phosphatase family protein [Candidatus Levybacteria bacterium]|nr:histidine phosphatase family protein [Candidatus Levybacteria bacterium]MBI2420627.1 histidine phosphatase family protein [Candidatus Levybacteria bacterium]
MAKIFLFRHAQTTDNVAHIFSGDRDPDLTEQGVKEAEGIRDALKNERVTKAFTSDRIRCKKTLEIVLQEHPNISPIIDKRIEERDYGTLTGLNKDEIAQKYPEQYPLWHRSYDVPPPDGESLKDVEKRVLEFLKDLISVAKPDDVILISASANSLRPIRRYFERMTPSEMASFEHTLGKVYSYEF